MRTMKAISLLLLVAVAASCSTTADRRREGFSAFDQSYRDTPRDPGTEGFRDQVILDDVRIKILDQQQLLFLDEKKNQYRHGVAGTATAPDLITILGKKVRGKIIVDQSVLGHEVLHLLQMQHPDKFHNPDELDESGL